MSCNGIQVDILNNCTTPLVQGTEDVMYLVNKKDIQFSMNNAYDPDSTGVLQRIAIAITLASGKYLRKYEGKRDSNQPSVSLKVGDYQTSYNHGLTFKIFSNSPLVKNEIEAMVESGDVVAIVGNNYRGENEDVAFEILGFTAGMEVTELTRDVTDSATMGAWSLVLGTPERSSEQYLPTSFVVTSTGGTYTATKAYLEAQLAP